MTHLASPQSKGCQFPKPAHLRAFVYGDSMKPGRPNILRYPRDALARTLAELPSEEAARCLAFGSYPRSGFMHINLGPARSWGEPFPMRAASFAPETRRARDAIAQSQTLNGTGAAGGGDRARFARRFSVHSQPSAFERARWPRRRAAGNFGAHTCHPPPDAGCDRRRPRRCGDFLDHRRGGEL